MLIALATIGAAALIALGAWCLCAWLGSPTIGV